MLSAPASREGDADTVPLNPYLMNGQLWDSDARVAPADYLPPDRFHYGAVDKEEFLEQELLNLRICH